MRQRFSHYITLNMRIYPMDMDMDMSVSLVVRHA